MMKTLSSSMGPTSRRVMCFWCWSTWRYAQVILPLLSHPPFEQSESLNVVLCNTLFCCFSSTACHKQGGGGILCLLYNTTNHSMATAPPLSPALINLAVFVHNCETDIHRHRFIGSVGMYLARQLLCSL